MSKKTNQRREPDEWTTKAFLDHFLRVHKQMDERKFAFILGAGASISSRVPSGSQLVDRWLGELQARDSGRDGTPVEKWATAATLEIENFKYKQRAEFYPQIYDRRFHDDREEGYAYLEDVMKNAHPGLGYSMLAQILGQTRHKVVITTNFDNLVADAVLLFTDTFAQTCGHESLTEYVQVQPRRPLIAKIHRDLLLGPQNDPYATGYLHENWGGTLRRIFSVYTPLVIGYGGNDGSLMNFLDSLGPNTIRGTLFWFYRGDSPNRRICSLVARQSGKLVQIVDFDVFMTQLAHPLGFGLLDAEIEDRAAKWASDLREEWKRVRKAVGVAGPHPEEELPEEASKQVRATLDRVESQRTQDKDDWWSWELRAQDEADPEKREAIYRKALEKLPDSPELNGNFANFLCDVRKNYDEAERVHRRAIGLDPDNVIIAGNFATFMWEVRKDCDEAERLFQLALELDPEKVVTIRNLALFMQIVHKDSGEAERLCRRALEIDPADADVMGTYALILYNHNVRKDRAEAERLVRRAMELDPGNAVNTAIFAGFLLAAERCAEARAVSDRAWSHWDDKRTRGAARLSLHRGLLLLNAEETDAPALGRLKTVFQTDFLRMDWPFDDVLSAAEGWLSEDDRKLYRALADAIVDGEKVAALDAFPRWKKVEPIPLDDPWENLGD